MPPPAISGFQDRFQIQQVHISRQSSPIGLFQGNPTIGSYYHRKLPESTASHPRKWHLYQQPFPRAYPPITVPLSYFAGFYEPWQHHHYNSPIHGITYPQSQARYLGPICSKASRHPSSLRTHNYSHTGKKPFKCPHAGCGKAFSYPSRFRTHSRSHTGDEPFKCPHAGCGKTCDVRSNMKRHETGCRNFNTSTYYRPGTMRLDSDCILTIEKSRIENPEGHQVHGGQ